MRLPTLRKHLYFGTYTFLISSIYPVVEREIPFELSFSYYLILSALSSLVFFFMLMYQ